MRPHHELRFPLVAGEPEQVAPVVQELMHIHAIKEGCGTLFCAHEIDREQGQRREDGPWQHFAKAEWVARQFQGQPSCRT